MTFDRTRYEVTGTCAVLDHEPGSFFEDDLDPPLEAFYLAGGHLRRVEKPSGPDLPRLDDPQPHEGREQ